MIGQKHLLEKLNSYTIDTFPRSAMFIGEKGMGKHLIVDYIKENIIKLPIIDITENLTRKEDFLKYLDAIYTNPNPSIYLIDTDKFTIKYQNRCLKLFEEPLNNSFIVLLAENRTNVLDTVLNRCVCFELEAYTKEELESFITTEQDKDLILSVVRSPGKIKSTNINNLRAIFDICDKIINKLDKASFPNTLSICNKINFKDDYDKFDLDIFFDSLLYLMFNNYLETNNKRIYEMYKLTREQRKILLDKRINKELFFQNYLTKLWLSVRN